MAGYIILLVSVSVFVASVHGSCSSLATDIQTCYTNSGITFTTSGVDTFSTFLNNCSKVPELATCIGNAYNTCDSSVVVFLPDAVAVKAAYIGLCNKKAVFQAGLTCMTNSGVDVFALGASCLNITAFTNVITEAASGSWQGYCSYIVTMYDCYMDGYTCDDEFETAYRNFAKALLPSKCRDFSTSLSPWIATYGAATT